VVQTVHLEADSAILTERGGYAGNVKKGSKANRFRDPKNGRTRRYRQTHTLYPLNHYREGQGIERSEINHGQGAA